MAIEGEKFGSVEIEVALDFERLEREKRSELPKRMQQVGRLSAEEIRKAEAEYDRKYSGKSAEEMAKNTVRELKNQYRSRVGEARAALIEGVIDRKEFTKQARLAARDTNAAILSEMKAVGKGNAGFGLLASGLVDVEKASGGARAGMGRLNETLSSALRQVAGVHPALGQFVNTLGTMAIGGAVMTGVLLGMTALVTGWKRITEGAREAKEETEEAWAQIKRVSDERDLRALGPGGDIAKAIDGVAADLEAKKAALEVARKALEDAKSADDAGVSRASGLGGGLPQPGGVSSSKKRLQQLQEDYDEALRQAENAETELAEIRARADREAEKRLADFRLRVQQEQAQLAREREREAQEAQRTTERLEGLKDDLQKHLVALTATAADDLLLVIDKMEADFYEAARQAGEAVGQGTIDGIQELRDNAVAIQALEGFQEQVRGMLRLDDRGAQQQALSDIVPRLRQETAALKEGSRVRKEYLDLVEKVEEALKKNAEAIGKETEAERKRNAATIKQQRQDELRDLRDRARLIEENARAGVQLAAAIGRIDDEAAKALENLVQLGGAIFRIAGGDLSAIPSAIGAIASLVGSFLGGNKAEAAELQQQLAENARRIRENTEALKEFRERALSGISGSEREEVIRTGLKLGDAFLNGTPGETKTSLTNKELEKWSELVGIDIPAWLQSLEDITGLEFFDPEKGITDLQEFRRAWKDFLEKDLGAFDDSISGAIDAMLFKWSILGDAAGTAAEKVDEFIDVLRNVPSGKAFADALAAALEDGGAEAANALIDEWARRFAAGDQSLFAEGGPFFGLDADEVRRLLEEGNGLLEDALAGGPGGTTRDAVQLRSITDVRASRIEGGIYGMEVRLATANEQREMVIALLQQMAGVSPSPGGSAEAQSTAAASWARFSVGEAAPIDPGQYMPAGAAGGPITACVSVSVGDIHLGVDAGDRSIIASGQHGDIRSLFKDLFAEAGDEFVNRIDRRLAAKQRSKLSAAGRQ